MGLRPRIGAVAYDERGQLGVVQGDTSANAMPLWSGITLPHGDQWTSRSPRVVAYLDQIAPFALDPAESNAVRCSVCDGLFTWDEAMRVRACPRCFSTSAPESPGNDFVVRMNWEEARLLALFAHSWATQAKLPSVSHVRLERLFSKFRRSRPENTLALLDHEVQEEAALEESFKTLADRLVQAGGGRSN